MAKWPIGVFTSIDAGLGVKLDVAHQLCVPTIQLHAPARETRTTEDAQQFLARVDELGYAGPLTIEREIAQEPERQETEIGHAIRLPANLKERIG